MSAGAGRTPTASAGSSTVVKALGVLATLGEFPFGATAGEVAQATGHPFSTAYRLLNTLVDTGFATYDRDDKRYALGLEVFRLGQRVAQARGFSGTAQPLLRRLTEATGESSVLAVLDGARALTVYTADGPEFRTTTDPGDRGPLHTSAIGKILLSFASDAERAELLDTLDLTARTPRSITSRDALRAEVTRVREQGWAGQSEENDVGMVAVGVPVLAPDGTALASLALAAPLFRTDLPGLEVHIPLMRRTAAELALVLPAR